MVYVYIGMVPLVIVGMLISYKKLRNYNSIRLVLLITFAISLLSIFIRTPEAAMLSGAFVYTACYAALRYLFKPKYQMEPTYYRSSWYDPDEGRMQNWFDVVVFVVPLFLSFMIPFALIILKSNMTK